MSTPTRQTTRRPRRTALDYLNATWPAGTEPYVGEPLTEVSMTPLHRDRPDCGSTACYWHGAERREAARAKNRASHEGHALKDTAAGTACLTCGRWANEPAR